MKSLALSLLVLAAACAPVRDGPAPPRPATLHSTITVTNDYQSDVTVYVVRSGMRERLGRVSRMETKAFRLSHAHDTFSERLALVAYPVGSAPPQVTQPIQVQPGTDLVSRITNTGTQEFVLWVDPRVR